MEHHLRSLLQDALREQGATIKESLSHHPLALILDWENVKIPVSNLLKSLPDDQMVPLRNNLTEELNARILDFADKHGKPRQKHVVANWDLSFFAGDQKFLKNAGYSTEIASDNKANASDHVLVEKIHFVLREHPEIDTFIIVTGDGDFQLPIQTLQDKGKEVYLWTMKNSII